MTTIETERMRERADFLQTAGWADATAHAIAGDASSRSYERLKRNGASAVLMNAPPAAESAACTPDATPSERKALGYNALARLAGPNLNAFIAIANALRGAGLSAPEIYHADPTAGFALIEDLGDALFVRAVEHSDEQQLYRTAVDALLSLRRAAPPPPATVEYAMLDYDRVAMDAEIGLLTEWYWPHRTGDPLAALDRETFDDAWRAPLDALSAPHAIVLRDFHAENLLWSPERSGVARVGVIDFQDGLFGHAAYDLVSLLQDARRDVAPALAREMLDYYCAEATTIPDFDEDRFRGEFAILGAQRNAKILGVFARLIDRDGKPRYRQFMPRVEAHFRENLRHPSLAAAREFFASRLPELAP